jgi:hypothetical protein
LFFNVMAIVTVLILLKAGVHYFNLEFLPLDTLFPSVVAGTIFIVGFLLTGMLPDYKEAERLPGRIRVSLEALHQHAIAFGKQAPSFDVAGLRARLRNIVLALRTSLGPEGHHSHLETAIAEADKLYPYLEDFDRLGIPSNVLVRLHSEMDALKGSLFRIHHIQKTEFVPSARVLIQTLVGAILFLLLCLKTDGSYGATITFGFVSYLFVYSMHLISVFEQPFRQGEHSADKVSLFLLSDFLHQLDAVEAPRDTAEPASALNYASVQTA